MSNRRNLRLFTLVALAFLLVAPAGSFAGTLLGNHSLSPRIQSAHAVTNTNLVFDCAYGSSADGGIFPSSVVTSAPYPGPDYDGTPNSSCQATYLADTETVVPCPCLHPLVSDNPTNTLVTPAGSGGGLTIDVVAALNATTTMSGFDIGIKYDPHVLNAVLIDQSGLAWGGAGLPAGGFVITLAKTIDPVAGTVRLAQVLVAAPQQGGASELFRIRFDVVGASLGSPISFFNDVLANPGTIIHNDLNLNGPGVDTTSIYNALTAITANLAASWAFSPNPEVPLSPLTVTATATCPGCTGVLTYAWDFSSVDTPGYVPKVQATTNPATITPPPPVVYRVTVTITDGAAHSFAITRSLPLVLKESPSFTTLARHVSGGAWSSQWLGGVVTGTVGYSGGWVFCPGSAFVRTVCSVPSVGISQPPASVTQVSSAGAENYNYAGLYNATLKVSDAPEAQIGTSPTGTVVKTNLLINVTGTPFAYTINESPNATSTTAGKGLNFTAFTSYTANYTTSFRSVGFKYAWDFGDGGTGTSVSNSPVGNGNQTSIVHTFLSPGTFIVRVIATETANAAVTHIVEVNRTIVNISPGGVTFSATVSGPATGAVNQVLTYNANVIGGTAPFTYAWAVTGGSPASGTASSFPTSFAVKGTYNVTLTVTDNAARTAKAFMLVTVSPLALLLGVTGPTTGTVGATLTYNAAVSGGTTPYTYAWAVTGGSPASGTAASFATSFAVKGTYNVTLTVTDHNAKSVSAFQLVTISAVALTASVSGPATGTASATLTYNAVVSGGTTPYTYAWAVTGGSPASGTAASFATSFAVKGTYNVTLTVTDHNGATAKAFKLVTISPLTLTASITGPTTGTVGATLTFNAVVSGGTTPYTYAWAVTGGSPASGTAASFATSFAVKGTYNVTLTVTDHNGATAKLFQLVVISATTLTASVSGPASGAVGATLTYNAVVSGGTTPYTFAWAVTGGNPASGTASSFPTSFAVKGTYNVTLTVTDHNGATAKAFELVTISPLTLTAAVNGPATGTVGATLTYTAVVSGGTSPYTYAWAVTGGNPASGTASSFPTSFAVKGTYNVTLTVTDHNAATAKAFELVTISPLTLSASISGPTSGSVNQVLTFNAVVSGGTTPYTYAWAVTGGSPASGTASSFPTSFAVKGTYNVTLTVTDHNAATAKAFQLVTISAAALTASVSGPATGTVGATLTYTAVVSGGTTPYTYAWAVTGGSPASGTASSFATSFAVKGTYNVTLTVTDHNGASAKAFELVTISPLALTAAVNGPASGTVGATLTYTAVVSGGTTPYTYAWAVTGGSPASGTASSFATSFAVKGTYNVTLTVTDHNAATAKAFELVIISPLTLTASVSGPATGTVNQILTYNAVVSGGTTPYTYAWAVTGGSPASGTASSFATSFAVKGTYNVTLTVTDHNAATAKAFQLVVISPLALAASITGPTTGTVNQVLSFNSVVSGGTTPYTYAWAVTGGSPASGTASSFSSSFAVKGTYNVTLTVTDHNGKTASAFSLVSITSTALLVTVGGPTTGTVGATLTFTSNVSGGTTPYTYSWAVTGGNPSTGTASSFPTSFAVKGTYNVTLTVTDHNGAKTSAFQLVTISPLALTAAVNGPATGTVGATLTYTAVVSGGTTPYTYAWAVTGGSPASGTASSFATSFAVKGTYNVTLIVTDHNGATAKAFELVVISPLALTASVTGPSTGTVGATLTFNAVVSGGTTPYTYAWAVTGGSPASGTASSFATSFAVKGTYNVTLTVTDHNAATAKAFQLVTISPLTLTASVSGPATGTVGATLTYTAVVSGGTTPYTYAWAVTGGSPASGTASSFATSFAVKGTYNVTLTVTDHNAATAKAFQLVTISPLALTASVSGPATGTVGATLTYNAVVSGGTTPYTYAWAVTGGSPASGTASSFATSFAVKGTYNVTLTVTDHNAATAKAFELVTISPLALTASITGPTTGTVNQVLTFNAVVSGGTTPYTYAWAVTGGSPASGTASSFVTSFSVKGTYNVTLTVTDHNAATAKTFHLVTISPLTLTASVNGPATGTVGATLTYTAVVSGGTTPYTYAWAVTGGSPASGTASSFATSFAVKGTYNVTLTVTDHNAATAKAFELVTISPLTLTASVSGPASGTVGATLTYNAVVSGGTTPYAYAWAVTGGSPASGTASSFATSFAVKGTYNVTLTVIDHNAATAKTFQLVVISATTLTASVSGPATGTVGATLTYNAVVSGGTTPYAYAWAVTGGSPASGTASSFATSFAVKGTYNVTLTVTDHNGATAKAFELVTISPLALTASVSGPAAGSVGATLTFNAVVSGGTTPYTYAWAVTGGSPASGTASSFAISFAVKGTYNVTLTVTDHNAATAKAFQLVVISPLALTTSVSGPATGTVGATLTYSAVVSGGTTPYTYAWAVTGGSPASGTASSFATSFAVKGTYNVTLTVTDHNAATAKAFQLVTISPLALTASVTGPTTSTVNQVLTFNAVVSGGTTPYTYAWAVTGGSPTSGTASSFSTSFAVKGTYNVTLTVTDHNAATAKTFQLVVISATTLTASVSGPATGTVGATLTYSAVVSGGTTPYTYAWAVTGGSPASGTASSFATSFAVKGTYNVTLTVTDHNGAAAKSFELVTISPLTLTASITGPTTGTVGATLTFNSVVSGGTTPYTYAWAVTGGSPASGTASSFATSFAVKGTYNVTLTVTDHNAATAKAFQLVTISPLALTASVSGPATGTVGATLTYNAVVSGGTTPYTYAWAVTGGSPSSGTASSFATSIAVKGTYNVTLTVTDHNAATAKAFELVTISPLALTAAVSGPSTGTVGATLTYNAVVSGGTTPYTYAWAVTGGSPASGTASSFGTSFAVKGTYNVTLTVTDHNAATAKAFQLVTISPLTLTASVNGPSTGTVGATLTYNAVVNGGTTPYTYAWAVTGGSPASGTASSFATSFAVKGTYNVTLTVTDHNAATAKAFELVTISPLALTAAVNGPATGTVGATLTYTAVVSGGTTPYTYAWAVTGGSPASGTASSFATSFAVKGTYNVTLTVTDHNGATAKAFELVTISPLTLAASITGPTSGTVNQVLTFNAVVSGGTTPYTYAWAVTGGSPASGTASSFATSFAVKGTYNVTLTVTDHNAVTARAFQLVAISSTALTATITGPTTGTVGATLTFNAVVSGGTTPYAYAWAVTGGSPSSGTASSFATSFAVKGTYNVTLTVTDHNGATAKTFQLVTITPLALTASVSGPATGTVGATLTYNAVVSGGTTPYTYAWAVTGGSPASGTASSFATSFGVKGTYNVTLTVTDHNAATAKAFELVTVSPIALTATFFGPTTGTVGATLTYTAVVSGGTTPYTYAWAVTGGSPASGTASSFATSFAVKGTYNVTLTVTDHNAKTVSAFLLVTISPLALGVTVGGLTSSSINTVVTFTSTVTGGTSPYTYAWAVTGGSPASGTSASFSTQFAVKGTYNVTLTVTDHNAKTASAFHLITIISTPLTVTISGPSTGTVGATLSYTSLVSGGTSPYTYAWAVTGGNPASGTASSFSTSFAVKGTYNVTLTVTDHNGARTTAFQLVTISPLALTASVSGPATGTVGATLTYNAVVSGGTTPYTYAWAVTGGSPASGTASSFATSFAVKGTYNVTLTVTDHNGATAKAFQLVTISPLALTASVTGPTTGTVNQVLTFNAIVSGGTTPYTYAWAVTGGSPASGTASSFATSFAVKGTYNVTLTVTDHNAATAKTFHLVTVSPLALVASVTGPATGSVSATLTFNSVVSGGTTPYTYSWAVTGGSPASGTASSFSTSFAVKGTYNVTLTVTDHNGASAKAFQLVVISATTLTASVSGPATGTVGATLTYTAVVSGGTTPYTYAWAVTGGSPASGTASSFATSFAVKGTYNVTLTVTDHNGATAKAFELVTISPLALTAAVNGPATGTVGATLTYTALVSGGTTPYTYAWAVTGGSPASGTASSFATNFAVKGTYNVTLIVTDHNAANAKAFQLVTISPLALTASVTGPATGTVNQVLTFNSVVSGGTTPYAFAWAVTGGSPASGTASSFSTSFAVKGTYNVTLTVTDHNAATAKAFQLVTISPLALVASVTGPTSGSVGATLTFNAVVSGGTTPYTYAWAVTGGSPASGTASSFATSFAVKGTYNVTLTVTDHNAVTAKTFQLVTISSVTLTASVTGPATGTVGATLTYTAVVNGGTTPYTYAWAVTGGSPASGVASSFATSFAVKGTYNVTLTVTDHNGATAKAFELVTISPLSLTAAVNGPATGTVGATLTYTAVVSGGTTPYTYAWAVTGGSPASGTASSFATSFAVKGTYNITLTVTDHNAATAKAFELVTISPLALTASVTGPTTGTVGATLTFNAVVSGGTTPYTYAWAVTGGSTTSGTASSFATSFAVKGTYNVTLTVTDHNAATAKAFQLVTISPLTLTASVTGPATGSVNQVLTFNTVVSGGTTPYTYAWAVTGGSTTSGTASSFSTSFAVKGTYNVTLTVTDHNAATAKAFQLVVISATTLTASVSGPATGTVGATLTYTAVVSGGTTPYTYAWAVTGGSPSAGTASSFATSFAVKGTYNVTLTVTDHNGATAKAFELVTISPLALTAAVNGPATGTVGATLTYTAVVSGGTSPYTYAWAVTGGSPASGTAASFPTSFAVKGTYNVTLTVTDHNAATAKAFELVTISPLTLAASITGPTSGTVNQVLTFNAVVSGGTSPYTYAWAVTGGNPASGTASSFPTSFAVKGTYNVTLTVTDHNGATAKTFQLVAISSTTLTASITGPSTGTVGATLTFNSVVSGGTTPYTYAWAVTGGSPSSGAAASFATSFAVKGTYNVTLTVTDHNGATAKTFQLVAISSVTLTASVSGPATGTVGAILTYTAVVSGGTTPYTYAWAVTGGSPSSGTAASFPTSFAVKGTYNVTLTVIDHNGATAKAFQLVTISPLALTASVTGPTTGTVNQVLTFNSVVSGGTSPYTYAWAVTGGSPASGTASSFPTSFAVKGTYNVTLTVTDHNAATAKAFQLVTISPATLTASITGPSSGTVNQVLTFNAAVSGGTSPYTYAWAATGGSPSSGTASSFAASFAVKGTYNVTLTVTDHNGKTASAFSLVSISSTALLVTVGGPTTGTVGATLTFTSMVSGGTTPYTYSWAVTGGNPSTGTASSFPTSFAVKGTYNVTLTVTDHNGAKTSAFQLVTISPLALTAAVNGPATGTVGATLTYTAVVSGGTTPYTYAWAVTGGSPASGTASSFATSFAVKGTYNVTLTVTDHNGATAKAFQLVTITPLALAASVTGPASGTVNQVLTFNAVVSGGTTPYTYAWAVTGGSPASGTASSFPTSFAVKGTYNVTLTVTDHNSATAKAFQLVTISPLALSASINGPTSGTINTPVSFSASVSGGTSPYTYAWAVTGGSTTSGTASTFSTSFTVKGTYNITLTVTDHNAATASTFHLITISSTPLTVSINGPSSGSVNTSLSFTSLVSGGTSPYTYAWAVTGGSPASGTSSSFATSFAVKGTYNVTLTVTDHNGARTTAFQLVVISATPLAASVTGPASGTVNQVLTFNAVVSGGTTPYSYSWTLISGSPASGTASSFSTSFAVKGTYNVTLTVTDHNSATARAFQLVTISPLQLTVSISGPASGTVNQVLAYSAVVNGGTSPYTYAWTATGGSPSSGTSASLSTSFAVKGTYAVNVTVTDHNGAIARASQLVTITPLALTASISGPTTGTVNTSVSFSSSVSGGTSPYTYSWTVTGGSPASGTASTFSTMFAVKGTYIIYLTVTDHNGAVAPASQIVNISPAPLTASISGPSTGTVGSTLTFSSSVSGGTTPYTYSWTVTGGSPASGTASTFSTMFAVKGTYIIYLTVTDHNGAVAPASQIVNISPLALMASISGPTSGTVGSTLSFTSIVTGGTTPYSYSWLATGGSPASGTAASFSTSFSTKGTYTVSLTVTDHNGVIATASQMVNISPLALTISAISGPSTGTTGTPVTFSATASGGTQPYTFTWYFGDGSTGTTGTHTYTTGGTFMVTVTVTDHNGATASSAAFTINVTVVTNQDADGDGIADNIQCTPGFTNCFTDIPLGGTTFGTILSRGDQCPTIPCQLTVQESSPSTGILITSGSAGGLTPASISVCGGAAILSEGANTQLLGKCGTVTITVIAGSVGETLVGSGTFAGITGTTTITAGNSLTFDPTTFSFTAPATNTSPIVVTINGQTLTITPGQTTSSPFPQFTISVISPKGEVFAAGAVLKFDAKASFALVGPITNFVWNFGDGVIDTSNTAKLTHTYAAAGTYTVTLTITDNFGKSNSASQTITVIPAPLLQALTFAKTVPSSGNLVQTFTAQVFNPNSYSVLVNVNVSGNCDTVCPFSVDSGPVLVGPGQTVTISVSHMFSPLDIGATFLFQAKLTFTADTSNMSINTYTLAATVSDSFRIK